MKKSVVNGIVRSNNNNQSHSKNIVFSTNYCLACYFIEIYVIFVYQFSLLKFKDYFLIIVF
jgi:hypothetical protein